MVIVNFIRDKEVGLFARAKRLGKGKLLPSGCPGGEGGGADTPLDVDSKGLSDEEYSDKSE
jgi:sphingolipid delta-4 desaturase